MADTVQIVRWALAQSCRLRPAGAESDAARALDAVARARSYASLRRRSSRTFGVFGNVCVTSHTCARPPGQSDWDTPYPVGGFLVSKALRKTGGGAGLEAMCRNCPANPDPDGAAGCAGTFYFDPDSEPLQEQLASALSRPGLTSGFADVFPVTSPLWFGLWARSPVPKPGLRLLRELLSGLDPPDPIELHGFLRATRTAEDHGLALHVSLAPPGHTDLGYYTVFPHCPFCKADARLARWQSKCPADLHTCRACGTRYSPAETASSEKMPESPGLREQLGPPRFAEFARSYLVAGGLGAAAAESIVEANESEARGRAEEAARQREQRTRRDRFVNAILYAGLHPTYRPETGDDAGPAEEAAAALFDVAEFERLLLRCKAAGVRVVHMWHHSESQELRRFEYLRPGLIARFFGGPDPIKLLARWRRQGCGGLFGGSLDVPDHLVEQFERSQPPA